MNKLDCFTPIEENWDGWELDWERSSSTVIYAKVPQTDLMKAIELGWMLEQIYGPTVDVYNDEIGGPVEMFVSIDQEVIFL